MPTQHDIEAEVQATVHAFLKAWVQQGAGAIDHFLTYVAETIKAILSDLKTNAAKIEEYGR